MSESGLQMSGAERLHFHFEATSVKGIYLLRRDPVAGKSTEQDFFPVSSRRLAHSCPSLVSSPDWGRGGGWGGSSNSP